MPWTADDQRRAEERNLEFRREFNTRMEAWKNTVSAGQQDQSQAAVEDTLNRWRGNMHDLQNSSEMLIGNDSVMDSIGILATQVSDEKAALKKLRSESGTRTDQAESVNPKIRSSPSTNILWLNRVFRKSTRLYLLIFSIMFGALALGGLVYFVNSTGVIQNTAQLLAPRQSQAGGGRRK